MYCGTNNELLKQQHANVACTGDISDVRLACSSLTPHTNEVLNKRGPCLKAFEAALV